MLEAFPDPKSATTACREPSPTDERCVDNIPWVEDPMCHDVDANGRNVARSNSFPSILCSIISETQLDEPNSRALFDQFQSNCTPNKFEFTKISNFYNCETCMLSTSPLSHCRFSLNQRMTQALSPFSPLSNHASHMHMYFIHIRILHIKNLQTLYWPPSTPLAFPWAAAFHAFFLASPNL